jgi:hypothetical protein
VDPEPGAVVATQSFGELAERFHPHLHILATDGAFYGKGLFRVASRFPMKALERLFRHKVLRMLLDKGRLTPETIRIMDRWRHSGFNVYCGPRILPREKKSLERPAAYLIRSSFSQERMEYLPDDARPAPRAHSPPPASQGRPDPSFSQLPPAYEDDFSQLPPAQWDF